MPSKMAKPSKSMSVKLLELLSGIAYCFLVLLFLISVVFLRLPFLVINPYKKFTQWWVSIISSKMGTLSFL